MIRQTHWSTHHDLKHLIEVGNRDSAIRIEGDYFRLPLFFQEWASFAEHQFVPHPDLVMLYEYLKESGRVIHMPDNIAAKTIQFLKETN